MSDSSQRLQLHACQAFTWDSLTSKQYLLFLILIHKLFFCIKNNDDDNHHHHHPQGMLTARIPLTLSRHLSLSVIILANPLHNIKCSHRADEYQFLQIDQNWCVHVSESIRERRLWALTYFISSAQHVLLILFECFMRWG